MTVVGSLQVPVQVDMGPLERDLNRVKKMLEDFKKEMEGVTDAMDDVNNSTSQLMAQLKKLGAALLAALGVRELINYTNVWTDLNSRVTLAAGSVEKGAAVMERLGEMARRTYSSIEQTAESYIGNATALRELGKSTLQTLDYTEALNNALVVSGARGQRAASVSDALTKAMALGKLSGDQLNTVIQSGGRVAEVLAAELGTTVNNLRNLGAQGKITGDVVFNALTKRLEQLRTEADAMPATIGDALLLIRNSLLQTVGVFDQANQISSTFAQSLIWVADNMQRLLTYVATATVAWGAYRLAVIAATVASRGLVAILASLRVALIRTGIGALVVLAGELVYQFTKLVEETGSVGDAFKAVFSIGKQSIERLGDMFTALGDIVASMAARMTADFQDAFATIVSGLAYITQSSAMGDYAKNLTNRAAQNRNLGANHTKIARELFGIATRPFEYDTKKKDAADLSGDSNGNSGTPPGDGKKSRAEKAYERIILQSKQFIAAQQLEARTLGMTAQAAAQLAYQQDLLNQAQEAGINLTPQQTDELNGLAEQMAAAEEQTRRLVDSFEFGKDIFKGFFSDIRQQLGEGANLWEAFGTAVTNVLNKLIDKLLDSSLDMLFNSLFGGSGGKSILSSLFGGLTGHATGTQYSPGGTRWVGERGPELMNVPSGARVTPNNRLPGMAGSGGTGTTVQLIDQRSAGSPEVEQQNATGPNGEQMLRFIIRDEQAKNIATGRMDGPQRARFGQKPRTI